MGLVTCCHFTDEGNAGWPQGREAKHGEEGEGMEKDAQGAVKSALDMKREDRKIQNTCKEEKYPEVKESKAKHEPHMCGAGSNSVGCSMTGATKHFPGLFL